MTRTPDRFVIEIGSGTVAHIVVMDASKSAAENSIPLGLSAPGEKMCRRGYRDYRSQRVPFPEFVAHHDIVVRPETTMAELARLREGDRLSLVYDFGTPSHYYCIVKEVYEPDVLDDVLDGDNVITSTDTAAIVREKRP